MKRAILSIAIATVFAACNHKPAEQTSTTQTQVTTTADTSGLAAFNDWKQKQEIISNQQSFTTQGVNETEPVTEVKSEPEVIYRRAPVKEQHVVKVSRPNTHNNNDRSPSPEPQK